MRKTPFVILSTLAALFLLFLTPPSSQIFAQLDAPIAADGESRFFYHETPLTRNGLELHLSRVTKEFVEPTRDILLIHGLTYSSHVFNVDYEDYSLVRRLANFGYRVWRLDVAGYGRSERPDDGFLPNTEYAVEDIHAAVEAICKFERVDQIDLLGWSWGTITTSAFANRYPERVRRLVLYAPIFKGIGEAQVDDAYHANSWEHASEDFQRDENGEIDLSIVDPAVVATFCSNCWRYDKDSSPNGGRREACVPETTSLINLEGIKCPTFFVCGDKDPYIDLELFFAAPGKTPLGSDLVVLPGGGHAVMLEKSLYHDFQDAILTFLDKE